jgi:hypothetical protein
MDLTKTSMSLRYRHVEKLFAIFNNIKAILLETYERKILV